MNALTVVSPINEVCPTWGFKVLLDSTDVVTEWCRDWGSDIEIKLPLNDLVAKGKMHNREIEIMPRSFAAFVTTKTHVAAVAFQLRFCEEIMVYNNAAKSKLHDPIEFEIAIHEIIRHIEYDLVNEPRKTGFRIDLPRVSIGYDYRPIPPILKVFCDV